MKILAFLAALVCADDLEKAGRIANATYDVLKPIHYNPIGEAALLAEPLAKLAVHNGNYPLFGYMLVNPNATETGDIVTSYQESYSKAADLVHDMLWYWEHLLELQNSTCFAQLEPLALKAVAQADLLNGFLNGTVGSQNLIDGCSDCLDTASSLYGMFDGDCNLPLSLYDGFYYGGYYIGWADQISSKAAFIMSLANLVYTAGSAVYTLEQNLPDCWQDVVLT